MSKNNFIQTDVVSNVKLFTAQQVNVFRSDLTNAYGPDIYTADDMTVSLLHDLALINSGRSPKVYI